MACKWSALRWLVIKRLRLAFKSPTAIAERKYRKKFVFVLRFLCRLHIDEDGAEQSSLRWWWQTRRRWQILTMAQTRGKKSLLRLTNSTAKHLTDFCCKLLFLFLLLLLLLSLHLHFHLPTAAQFAFAQVEERWHRTCISMTIFPFAIFRLPRVQCSPVARDGQRYGNSQFNLLYVL